MQQIYVDRLLFSVRINVPLLELYSTYGCSLWPVIHIKLSLPEMRSFGIVSGYVRKATFLKDHKKHNGNCKPPCYRSLEEGKEKCDGRSAHVFAKLMTH